MIGMINLSNFLNTFKLINNFHRPRFRKTFDSISQDPGLCGRLILVFLPVEVRSFIKE
jgi:hypothetical protein